MKRFSLRTFTHHSAVSSATLLQSFAFISPGIPVNRLSINNRFSLQPSHLSFHSLFPQQQDLPAGSGGKRELHPLPIQPSHTDADALCRLLRSCTESRVHSAGMCLHALVIMSGLEHTLLLQNLLIQMHSACGALLDAHAVFTRMLQRNVFSWALMIGANVDHGYCQAALSLSHQIVLEGDFTDNVTCTSILSACSSEGALVEGMATHVYSIHFGLQSNVIIGTALVSMYGKYGLLPNSQQAFDHITDQNVISWNALIAVNADHGHGEEAFQLFKQMQLEGMVPNRATYVTIGPLCSSLLESRQIHAFVVRARLESDVAVGTTLVNIYGKLGTFEDVSITFSGMLKRNVVSYNSMIAACVQHGKCKMASHCIWQMRHEGMIPNKATFVNILAGCVDPATLLQVKHYHVSIFADSDLMSNLEVQTTLLKTYSTCNNLEEAQKVFMDMADHNIITWNTIVGAYARHENVTKCFELLERMEFEGVFPDKVTHLNLLSVCSNQAALSRGIHLHVCLCLLRSLDLIIENALLNMYGKCGNLHAAWALFKGMQTKNIVSWNTMISAYAECAHSLQFLSIYQGMQFESFVPDNVTYVALFSACESKAALAEGRRIHACIYSSAIAVNTAVGNSILNMYSKLGWLVEAKLMFEKIPKRNIITWNAMIGAYCQNGKAKDALQTFEQMQLHAERPDEVTYFNILSACSHAGLVEEGCKYFFSMIEHYGIEPTVKHFNCMVALLGRAGRLDDGENIIKKMPVVATSTSWMALLAYCRLHYDKDRGRRAAHLASQLKPDSAAPYVCLANISAVAG